MLFFHSILMRPATGCILAALLICGCKSPAGKTTASTLQTTNGVTNVPLAILHGPFLQAPTETSITISWGTSRKCVSRLEYKPEKATNWMTNTPAHFGLVDADVSYQNVTLTNLEPGTRYLYRVVSREIADFKFYRVTYGGTVISAEFPFSTLNSHKTNTSFVVVNDRHEKVSPLLASLNAVKWTNVDLVFMNGDMVNAVKDEQQLFQSIIDPCTQAFASRIPMIYVRGNHDTRGSFARHLMEYFPSPSGQYYRVVQQGPVSFLILDCGEDKADSSSEYYGLVDFESYMNQQVKWLAQAIEEPAFKNAPFRVCFLHIPPGAKPDAKFIRPQWLLNNIVPLLNKGKVDLMISAHTHKFAVQEAGKDGIQFPIITGGTETLIRCDATPSLLRVLATDLSGKALPQLEPIKRVLDKR